LKLTPEQREQIQTLHKKHRAANQVSAETLRGLHEKLRATLFGENPAEALEIANEIGRLEAQLLPSRVALQIEIVKQLTPEQKKIAMQRGLFGPEGMGPGHMGPDGPGGMGGGRGGQPPVKK
jgi:Spy/CpxP family protein refolding chaperone